MTDTEDRLAAALDRADAVLERAARVEQDRPCDPGLEALMARACGPEAPLELRSVADRVRRGSLTWDDVWRDPHAHGPEAVRAVQCAIVELARTLGP